MCVSPEVEDKQTPWETQQLLRHVSKLEVPTHFWGEVGTSNSLLLAELFGCFERWVFVGGFLRPKLKSRLEFHADCRRSRGNITGVSPTWRIIPVNKWLVIDQLF